MKTPRAHRGTPPPPSPTPAEGPATHSWDAIRNLTGKQEREKDESEYGLKGLVIRKPIRIAPDARPGFSATRSVVAKEGLSSVDHRNRESAGGPIGQKEDGIAASGLVEAIW